LPGSEIPLAPADTNDRRYLPLTSPHGTWSTDRMRARQSERMWDELRCPRPSKIAVFRRIAKKRRTTKGTSQRPMTRWRSDIPYRTKLGVEPRQHAMLPKGQPDPLRNVVSADDPTDADQPSRGPRARSGMQWAAWRWLVTDASLASSEPGGLLPRPRTMDQGRNK